MATPGKLNARITVPTGGWTIALTDEGSTANLTLPAGQYYHDSDGDQGASTDLPAYLTLLANAAMGAPIWTVTLDAAGQYRIGCTGATCTLVFTDTELRDLLGFDANQSGATAYTGVAQAQGLWLPTLPFQNLNGGGTWRGWWETDKHSIETSGGHGYAIMGRKKRVTELTWPMEPRNKTWAANETDDSGLVNGSYESFLLQGVWGSDSDWGTPGGPIRFHPDQDDSGLYGTYFVAELKDWQPNSVREYFHGLWEVRTERLVEVPGDVAKGLITESEEYAEVDTAAMFAALIAGDGATLASAMGHGSEPDHYAILVDADGGADKIGSGDITTSVSTPAFQFANTTLEIDTVHLDSAADAVNCGNATDWDVANESMSLLYIGTLDSSPGNNEQLVGKGTSAAGFSIRTKTSGALECVWWFTGDNRTVTISADHYVAQDRGDLVAVLMTSDRTADICQAWSSLQESDQLTAQSNDITNATAFGVGAGISNRAASKPALVALWTGANSESMREANLSSLLETLGLGIYDDV